ncbi:hypothetical protein B0H11DRAFT_1909484 [Mycena galericulata]|nr:hypothetical protein B0H11DRAFT_1923898 [Mycena galericulata]KAJ7498447.1 hypothetical protein B0H11DRAFT_1909484 [Mycena galericulata]
MDQEREWEETYLKNNSQKSVQKVHFTAIQPEDKVDKEKIEGGHFVERYGTWAEDRTRARIRKSHTERLPVYVRTILWFGASDSHSTQTGELEHRRVERFYARTNKNTAVRQMTVLERREQALLRISRKVGKMDAAAASSVPSVPIESTTSTLINLVSNTAPHDIPIREPCHEGLGCNQPNNRTWSSRTRTPAFSPLKRPAFTATDQDPRTSRPPVDRNGATDKFGNIQRSSNGI